MTSITWFGIAASALIGLGVFGLIVNAQLLRKIIAVNVLSTGVFLLFGVIARRGAEAGLGGDPVPQAMVITGIVVSFSATALAVTLLLQLFAQSGTDRLEDADISSAEQDSAK